MNSTIYLVSLGQAVEDAEHEGGASVRVAGKPDAQRVQKHLVEGVGEQRLRKLPQKVLQHA